jgi:hypothetical protein
VDVWQLLVLIVGVLILLTAVVYGIQSRRRRGSVMAQRSRGRGAGGRGSSGGRS